MAYTLTVTGKSYYLSTRFPKQVPCTRRVERPDFRRTTTVSTNLFERLLDVPKIDAFVAHPRHRITHFPLQWPQYHYVNKCHKQIRMSKLWKIYVKLKIKHGSENLCFPPYKKKADKVYSMHVSAHIQTSHTCTHWKMGDIHKIDRKMQIICILKKSHCKFFA